MTKLNDVKKFFDIKKYRKSKLSIFMWLLFYLGTIIGSFCNLQLDFFENIFFQKIDFFNLEIFNKIIFTEILIILILFLFSVTIFGVIISYILAFTRGLGIGIIIYLLYSKFFIKGIIFGTFALLPGLFISSAAQILFAIKSAEISILIIKKIIYNYNYKYENLLISKLKLYIKNLGESLLISSFGVFIHVLLVHMLLKLFKFF